MPISQSRVIALADGFDKAIMALRRVREAVDRALVASDARQALIDLDLFITANCQPDISAVQNLAREQAHFAITRHRNNRYAARARLKRGNGSPEDEAYGLPSAMPGLAAEALPEAMADLESTIERAAREYDAAAHHKPTPEPPAAAPPRGLKTEIDL